MTRRDFTKSSTVLLSMSLLSLKCKAQQMIGKLRSDFGLQLYSVRAAMQEDPVACLSLLSEMGYTHIEHAGYQSRKFYGMAPKEYKKLLDDLGLAQISGHCGTGYPYDGSTTHSMNNNWKEFCEDAANLHQKYLVLGWIAQEERQSIDDYKRLAEKLNKSGEVAKEFGISMLFHNHDFEFKLLDGQIPYDVLLAETETDKCNFELDFYWYRKAGVSYKEYISNHPGRFPLWHIKDMDDTEDQFFTEVGSGVIDWKEVFTYADKAGLEQYYVEQDDFRGMEPLASVEKSYDYLYSLVK